MLEFGCDLEGEREGEREKERESALIVQQWRFIWTKKRYGNVQNTPRSVGGVEFVLHASVTVSELCVLSALTCARAPAAPLRLLHRRRRSFYGSPRAEKHLPVQDLEK